MTDNTRPKIGFIGLGLMGGNMVECLQKNDFELSVIDLDKTAVATVLARGNATEAQSPKELAESSDIIMLCLTTSAVVENLMYADDGILAGVKEGAVLIDFGTSIPASTRKIGADLAAKGVGMIDAPLGRTPPFMQFCKNYAVDGVSDLGFSIANANKDLHYFVEMVGDLGSNTPIAEGTSANLQAAMDADLGNGNVPEIFDYFLKLKK